MCRVTSWFDIEVPPLDFVLHDPATVVAAVKAAGLTDVEWYLRGPHEWRDETTQRLYVVARRVRPEGTKKRPDAPARSMISGDLYCTSMIFVRRRR
jgi:hypothetical protein